MDDTKALDELIDEAMSQEKALAAQAEELSLQSKQFADYLSAKKHNDEKLEMLWQLVKQHMLENKMFEHENDFIHLKITPTGKYRTEDLAAVDDEFCEIVRKLDNKKITAYLKSNGALPEGIESTGWVLRKHIKE